MFGMFFQKNEVEDWSHPSQQLSMRSSEFFLHAHHASLLLQTRYLPFSATTTATWWKNTKTESWKMKLRELPSKSLPNCIVRTQVKIQLNGAHFGVFRLFRAFGFPDSLRPGLSAFQTLGLTLKAGLVFVARNISPTSYIQFRRSQ